MLPTIMYTNDMGLENVMIWKVGNMNLTLPVRKGYIGACLW